mmetsp:Transcript_20051/g.63435  ORF Transcript_20051/g.63435 Transcript_20051/m.63435 type:complete len:355 (-) Transcript_20051:96-1160(-)
MEETCNDAAKKPDNGMHLNFGKRLAHTDKHIRDRGFKALKKWMQQHTEVSRLEFMKLWKGLFFAMWMADKRPVQQELAVSIALLINEVSPAQQAMWIDTFWETMQTAWDKLDKHRMNKYLLFVRINVAEVFKVLRLAKWESAKVRAAVESFTRAVPNQAKKGSNATCPGLLMQFNRLFWDELRPQLCQSPAASEGTIMELLEPFCTLAEGCLLGSLVHSIHEHVIRRTPPEFVEALNKRLLAGAARVDIPDCNRETLYESVDVLERVSRLPTPAGVMGMHGGASLLLPKPVPPSCLKKKLKHRRKRKKAGGCLASTGMTKSDDNAEGKPAGAAGAESKRRHTEGTAARQDASGS